jgi:Fe-S cluster assembly protein SufD
VHGFESETYSLLNGWFYSTEEKQLQTWDNGVVVGSMRKAQEEFPELFEKHFGKIADHKQNGFVAANTALFRDGIFIYVPDGVRVENTMQLIKMINREEPLMVNSRNLIILGKNSDLTFMHCDDSVNHYASFINTITEVYLDENANFDLYKLQNINDNTSLLNNTFFHQETNSKLRVNVLSLNGGKIRNELHVDLMGEYAEADLNGVYLMDKQQHIDNQVFVNHAKPNCYSNELFKGVLDEEATGIFNGYIYVARDAQHTNAFQRNNNILLTPRTVIDTMPFLEIYADDVKCSHGATIGQLDEEAMFYLMQRGISKSDARLLLMYAFLAEVTAKVAIEALRNNYEDMIKRRLRGELSICEKCVLHCSAPDKPVEFEIDMSKI